MQLILASSSPRRVELLKNAGFKFQIIKPDVLEIRKPRETPLNMVKRLSMDKAQAVWNRLDAESRVGVAILSADTTVVTPDGRQVLGKPDDDRHARILLQKIQGKTHVVITAYSILYSTDGKKLKRLTRAMKTRVTLRSLSGREIERYIRTGEPADKAGAYAAQGVGITLISKIQGSYSNVVGLPICEVAKDLEDVGCGQLFE